MDVILKELKSVILNVFKKYDYNINNIILFGSRARKDNNSNSDYDILIIIDNDIDRLNKFKIKNDINKKAAKIFIKNNSLTGLDIIIRSKNEINLYKDKIGSTTAEAYNEGIAL